MRRKLLAKLHQIGLKDRRALWWLLLIVVLTHFHWLFDPNIFTSGDWRFITTLRYHDFAHFSPIWVTDGFGTTSAVPSFYFVRFLEGLVTLLGGNFALNEKIFFFIPVTFGASVGTYIFLRRYFKEWPSFVGAIVFAFNTAMLFNYAGALTIAVADALTPIALLVFRQFLLEPKDKRWLLGSALALAVMGVYETRITLVAGAIAGGLFVFNAFTSPASWQYIRARLLPLAKLGAIIFGLHAFWLLPYAIGSRAGVTFSDLMGQGLFESFSDIQNALTLHHPFWTNARPATFVVQAIPLYAWLIPIAAFGGLALKRPREQKEIAYFALLGVVGLFLVKQVNQPLVDAYPWIFAHIPGFAAFRESSKFYLLIALSYAVLIPFTLTVLREWLHAHMRGKIFKIKVAPAAYVGISAVVLGLFVVNLKPLVTGEFRTTYIARHMPADYVAFNKFIDAQPGYFRTMWLPTNMRWGAQSNLHPNVMAANLTQGAWQQAITGTGTSTSLTLRDKAVNAFSNGTADAFLDRSSVKYVIVPLRDTANEDDVFQNFGDDRQYFINTLNHAPYLRRIHIKGASRLAVYENKKYQPHVAAATNVQSLDVTGNVSFEHLYEFISRQLHQPFNFAARPTGKNKKDATTYPRTQVDDAFQSIGGRDVQPAGVTKKIAAQAHPQLYSNSAGEQLRYTLQGGVMTFYGQPFGQLQVNGQPVGAPAAPEKVLASQPLATGTQYYLQRGETVVPLDARKPAGNLGAHTDPVALYATSGNNVLPNPSFEQGLWQRRVRDCNKYDDHGSIAMYRAEDDATDGRYSLDLESDIHTACTDSARVPVASHQYLLDFDYQVTDGQKAGYEIIFDNHAHTQGMLDVQGAKWQHVQRVVDVPAGAKNFRVRLLGYPDYKLVSHVVTNYDNVRMTPLNQLVSLPKPAPQFAATPLPANTPLTLRYSDPKVQSKNRIRNGSFEDGLWQPKVGDCNAYDDNPSLGMHAARRGSGHALELSARRHTACTSRDNIRVEENANYLLGFDYQSPSAQNASYLLRFNDPNHTSMDGTLPIKSTKWQTFTKQIRPPLGASRMSISVYAVGGTEGENIINRYDNFVLKELPVGTNQFYVADQSAHLQKPRRLSFTPRSATKTLVHVQGARTPFYLDMSESYNPLWRLELNNARTQGFWSKFMPWAHANAIPATQHFKLNDFENGWYVDPAALCRANPAGCARQPDGSYNIELVAEFTSQRWFYVGTVISAITLVGVVVCLVRHKRGRPKAREVFR